MINFSNKVVIVTGSSRGIGRAIVQAFNKAGAICIVNCDINEKEGIETLKTIQKTETKHCFIKCDVSDFDAVQGMVNTIYKIYGKINILVNNAGITRDVTLRKMRLEDWDAVIKTDLNSIFNCTKAVVEPMVASGGGRIINIGSVVGLNGNFGQSNYASAKAGIVGFTKSISKELAYYGITVNCIAPGFTNTSMLDKISEDQKTRILEQIPMRRFAEPEEVANLVLFLASDYASYITGQVISINGGWHYI